MTICTSMFAQRMGCSRTHCRGRWSMSEQRILSIYKKYYSHSAVVRHPVLTIFRVTMTTNHQLFCEDPDCVSYVTYEASTGLYIPSAKGKIVFSSNFISISIVANGTNPTRHLDDYRNPSYTSRAHPAVGPPRTCSCHLAMVALISVDKSLGALEIGAILSTLILGITFMQVYSYYTHHSSRDGVYLKSYVALLMVLDCFHSGLIVAFLYHYTITSFGDYGILQRDSWTFLVQVAIGSVLSLFVQYFYAYRIYNLCGKKWWIPLLVCFFSVAQLSLATAYIVQSFKAVFFANTSNVTVWAKVALAFHITCDVTITSAMLFYLMKNRGSTRFRRTQKMVTVLMTYALNTGLLTATCNIACLISLLAAPESFIFMLFFFIYVKLYSCSFMAILNSRDYIRSGFTGATEVITFSQLGTDSMRNAATPREDDETHKDQINIHIASEVLRASA